MEQKTLQAQTQPTTDLGEFEAIAAAWTEDREKDVIHRGAFEGTIRQWRRSGKRLPLHWDHKGDPDKIIGHIDPQSMRERPDGLYVRGQVDLEGSQLGREAWRLIKSGVVGLSFGYLPTQAKARSGGGRDLHELDMFEVSVTPAPMHPDTRILSTKGMSVEDMIEVKAWDGSASGYTDEEYAKATILDRADCDASLKDSPPKTRYAVPIAVPGSSASDSPDRGGVIAAAGGRGLTRVNACAKAKANAARKLIAAYGKFDGLEAPDSIKALAHEGEKAIEAREQRRRAEDVEFEEVAGKAAKVSDTPHPEPFSTSTTSNWVARAGGLPHYIQNIAHDLLEKGRAADESKAIEMAIGIVKNWAEGKGNVSAETRAKAAAAVAEWEKMKAEAHAKPGKSVKQKDLAKAASVAIAEWEQKKAAEAEAEQAKATLRRRADTVEFQEIASDDISKVEATKPDKPDQTDKSVDPEELVRALEGSHAKAASAAIAEWEQKKRAELEAEHEKATLRRRADAVELEEVAGDDLKPDEKAVPEKPAPQVGVSLEEIAALVEEAQAKAVEVAEAKWREMRDAELEAERKKAELRRHADAVEFQEIAGDIEAKATGGGGEVRMLQSMIAQGKEYMATEPDGNDKAMMNEILDLLTKLARGEEADQQAEGQKKLAPVDKGDEKPAKSRRDRDEADDADVTGEYRRVDPLRRRAEAVELEFFTDGESLRKQSPPVKSAPKPEPELSLRELEQRMRDEMLIAIAGGDEALVNSAE